MTEQISDTQHRPEISVIVPVYKVEKYLAECLDSIKAQTFADWECILVDDGSPDNCGKICDAYAAADSRFRVVQPLMIHNYKSGDITMWVGARALPMWLG